MPAPRAWQVLVALPWIGGCRLVAGVEDRRAESTSDAAMWGGPQEAYPAACRSCIVERCATELQSCADDVACDEGHRCLEGRIDPVSSTVCSERAPEASLLLAQTLAGCVSSTCLADCAPDLPWSCVEKYSWPTPSAAAVTVDLTLLAFYQQNPLPQVEVSACDRRDAQCNPPFDRSITDDTGRTALQIPLIERSAAGLGLDGFDGYFWLRGQSVIENLRFVGAPYFQATGRFEAIVLSREEVALSASLSGVTLDPARGIVVVAIRDCGLRRAAGVRFSLSTADSTTTPFYLVSGLPDPSTTETTLDGVGGFVNVPPGNAVVTAVLAATGREIGKAAFFVRADALTDVIVVPTWTR